MVMRQCDENRMCLPLAKPKKPADSAKKNNDSRSSMPDVCKSTPKEKIDTNRNKFGKCRMHSVFDWAWKYGGTL